LKDIYELILCTTTIYIVNKKNWIRMFVIVDALNHSSLSAPTQYSPIFHFELSPSSGWTRTVLNLYCGLLAISTFLKQRWYTSCARPSESKNSVGPSFGKWNATQCVPSRSQESVLTTKLWEGRRWGRRHLGYELECYLKDLPATVCCTDELPARV
jgi:hypothetical protein